MNPRACSKLAKKWNSIKRNVEKAIIGTVATDKVQVSHSIAEPHNVHYKNLQKCYLLAFFLAASADWLQGPYVYKLYSDYGYGEDIIAVLYTSGFLSSAFSGILVGVLADRYGRRVLCSLYAVLYTITCLTKTSSNLYTLLFGKILSGAATSILFTTFEAWYINEHLNFYKFPAEWLNVTLSKSTFYNGISAIAAGIIAQVFAEYLNFGPVAPFLISVPFLFASFIIIQSTWKEHNALQTRINKDSALKQLFLPLTLLLKDEKILLNLGLIQCIFESVMYTFVFSWTPILANLKPPLGLVFTLFMIAMMCGSKLYGVLVKRRFHAYNLLILAAGLAAAAYLIVTCALTSLASHAIEHDFEPTTVATMSYMCLLAFLLYEFALGLYFPAMGYLRGRVVPEECRASLINWFRVPMNGITCLSLALTKGDRYGELKALKKFQFLFFVSLILLCATLFLSWIFSKKYLRKILRDELAEVRAGKNDDSETV